MSEEIIKIVIMKGEVEEEHEHSGTLVDDMVEGCPLPTQDIEVNLENRQQAIDDHYYGPMNPNEPSEEYWEGLAEMWYEPVGDVKKARCGNCAAFNVTSDMKECIAEGIGEDEGEDPLDVIDAGELGYCQFLKFKCAAERTCEAWVAGGPLDDDRKVS